MRLFTILALFVAIAVSGASIHAAEVGPDKGTLVIVGGGRLMVNGGRFYFLAPGDTFDLKERIPHRGAPRAEAFANIRAKPWPEAFLQKN